MKRTIRAALVVAVVALFALPMARSDAQETPPPAADPVLAILSPLASPVCAVAGMSTLLVPIVSGLVTSSLPAGTPSVGDLILNSLGPVFVVCGELPASPGTRCLLDDQITGLVPVEVSNTTGPLPSVIGALVDALKATLSALGLPPAAALDQALVCSVREGTGVTDAPPGDAPVEAPPVDVITDPGFDAPAFAPVGSAPLPSLSPSTTQPPRATNGPQQLVATVDRLVPGGIKVLQVIAVGLLGLTLLSGWAGSWMETRRQGSAT